MLASPRKSGHDLSAITALRYLRIWDGSSAANSSYGWHWSMTVRLRNFIQTFSERSNKKCRRLARSIPSLIMRPRARPDYDIYLIQANPCRRPRNAVLGRCGVRRWGHHLVWRNSPKARL